MVKRRILQSGELLVQVREGLGNGIEQFMLYIYGILSVDNVAYHEKTYENKTWLFQQLGLPWPISDRYYTLVMSHEDDPQYEDSYEIRWDLSDEKSAQQGKGMQMMLNRGGWRLISANAGQSTKVLYYLNADPGGALPNWVNNMANTVAVPKVIEAVRERVQTTSYPPR